MKENGGYHLCGLAPMWAEKKVYTYSFNTNNHVASSLYQELSVRGTTENKVSPCHCGFYVLGGCKGEKLRAPQIYCVSHRHSIIM